MRRFWIFSALIALFFATSVDAYYCCYRPSYRFYGGYRILGMRTRDNINTDLFPNTRNEFMQGAQFGVYYRQPYRIYAQVDQIIDTMNTKRKGNISWKLRRYETTGRLGITIPIDVTRSLLFSPFIGFAYRQFIDQGGTVAPFLQSKLTYSSYLFPVGLIFTWLYKDCFEMAATTQIAPTMRCLLGIEVIDGNRKTDSNLRFVSSNRDSVLIEASFTYKYPWRNCMAIDISVVPFYYQVWYGKIKTLDLPERYNQYFGATFQVGVRF